MSETTVTSADVVALTVLANGILPADGRDAGAAAVNAGAGIAARMRHPFNGPVYVAGLRAAAAHAQEMFGRELRELEPAQVHALLGRLLVSLPQFFRLLRSDVCALYLSDPGVWQRIGFPGPSADTGGHPDFDQMQT